MTGEQILGGLFLLAALVAGVLGLAVRQRGQAQLVSEIEKEQALQELRDLKAEMETKKLDDGELHARVEDILRRRLGDGDKRG